MRHSILVALAALALVLPGCSCLAPARIVDSVAGHWRLEYPAAGGATGVEPLLFLQADDRVEGCTPGLDLTGTLADDSLGLAGSGIVRSDTSALAGALDAVAPDRMTGHVSADIGGRHLSDDVTIVRWPAAPGTLTLSGSLDDEPLAFTSALAAASRPSPTSVALLAIGPDATTHRLVIDFPDAPETGTFALVPTAPTDDHARVRLVTVRGDAPRARGTLTVTLVGADRFEGSLVSDGLEAAFAVPMLGK